MGPKELSSALGVEVTEARARRLLATIPASGLLRIGEAANEEGFTHLSSISVTDWLEEGTFEISYHLWSYSDKLLLTLKTKIDRNNPRIDSLVPIWHENAQIHERELHEMFGVEFVGNPDLSPLFLEDWDGPPPFRKDFNWREYVQKSFLSEESARERGYYG